MNCILDRHLELAAVFAGRMKASHRAAVACVKERLGVKMKAPDILVTTPGSA